MSPGSPGLLILLGLAVGAHGLLPLTAAARARLPVEAPAGKSPWSLGQVRAGGVVGCTGVPAPDTGGEGRAAVRADGGGKCLAGGWGLEVEALVRSTGVLCGVDYFCVVFTGLKHHFSGLLSFLASLTICTQDWGLPARRWSSEWSSTGRRGQEVSG